MVTVVLLDEYEIVVNGLARMLEPFADIEVVALQAVGVGVGASVDVALFDTYGSVDIRWRRLENLICEQSVGHVALFTFDLSVALVSRALSIGLHGCLWKGLAPEKLADAIRRVAAGEVVVAPSHGHARVLAGDYRRPLDDLGLSARESEVLALLAEGLSNQQIADGLYLNVETVRSHLKQIYSKLDVHTRSQATARALRGLAFQRS